MIFSKLFGKKTKQDEMQNKFQSLVKELNPQSQLSDIEACAQCYNNIFLEFSSEKITNFSIKKEAIQFLQYLIPAAISVLGQNFESPDIFNCLESISSFIQKDKDEVPNLYNLTILILCSTNKLVLSKSRSILQNFTINTHFCEHIIIKHFIEIYKIGDSINKTNSDISYFFLQKCIEKTKSFSDQQLINEVKGHISESSSDHLNLIATICLYSKTQPDFDSFNQQIRKINNCSSYEILQLINNSLAKTKITELYQNPSNELGTSLIQLYLKIPTLFLDPTLLIKYLQFLDSKNQLIFFQNIQKQTPEKLKAIIEKVLPPWKYQIDGITLFTVLKSSLNSDQLISILNQILTSKEKSQLISAFSNVPNFTNLISSLFETIIEPDQFENEFLHLIQLVLDGSMGSIQCLLNVCSNNDPVNYINSLKSSFNNLIEVPNFVNHLPELADNELLQHYFLCPEIISTSVEKGLTDFIAELSKSGPHEIIDRIIIKNFDNSELKNLDQKELIRLSRGILQNESSDFGSVKIPSLIPKISQFNFSSLSDRYVVGKYLIERGIINIESDILSTIGVQFLTSEIAYSIIDKPKILFDVTNKSFPHSPLFQFERGKQESFLLIIDIKFTFYFRVDQYDQELIVLEANEPIMKFTNNALIVGDLKFPCVLRKWHKISINLTSFGSVHIRIDSVHKTVVNQIGNITIGSRTNPPGSTFYIKAPFNYKGQIGKSVIFVDYKGFAYHSPRINAIPKILSKLIDAENKEEFSLYFNSLLNIQYILSDSIDISVLLNLLRQILIIKYDLVTEEIVQVVLGLISINGTIDWFLFKNIFVDYILWSKLHKVLLIPVCSIIQNILISQSLEKEVVESLSLYHFFLDLSLFLNINSDLINSIIFLLSKYEEDKMSAFTIHLLKENIPQSISFIMENQNSILDAIPLKFIPFLKPKLALQILQIYSKNCISVDSNHNFDEFENIITNFDSLIATKDFWISILSIACNCSLQDIESFRGFKIKVPNMLNIIFKLLCKFYQRDFNKYKDEEMLLEMLSDVVCSMIFNTNDVDFYPFISSFVELSHFGLTNKNEIFNPILFDSFEPCRLPCDPITEPINEAIGSLQTPFNFKSEQFLNGKDLWFGIKGENFSEICDEITKRKLLFTTSRMQAQQQQQQQNEQTDIKIDKNKFFYNNVIKIITKFLLQMKEEKLTSSLENILLFGSNIDQKISIKMHQSIVFSYLKRSKPTSEFLLFIKRMIIAGWWEMQLDQLFSSICIYALRIEENDNKTWNSITDVLKCILSLTSDFTKIQINLYSDSIFHKKIICNISNVMFFFYILMSDSFLSCPKSDIQEIWFAFLFALGQNNLDELSHLIYGTNNSEIPILQRINQIVISTSFFTEISSIDSTFCTDLKNISKAFYENFINEQKQSMNEIYENIGNIRKMNKSNELNQLKIYDSDFIEKVTNEIEKFAFNVRFNILSSRNEIDSFTLWSILPKIPTNKYQIAPSVHPISVPTLLVPFFTNANLNDYKSYGQMKMIKINLNENDTKNSLEVSQAEIPSCIDSYVSQPFFNIGWKITKQLFISSFPKYGKFLDIDSILIISGLSEIPSVLITCERGFFIIIESSINETEIEKHIFLHHQAESLKINTFLDNCACGYYGKASLFNGHIVLQFYLNDIFIAAPRSYLKLQVAIEIWFVRGFSLFVKFVDKSVTDRFLAKFIQSQQDLIPICDKFCSIYFSKHLCKKVFIKNKNEIEKIVKKWSCGKLSNFEYLIIINFLANRSFSCAFQYPVVPWTIKGRIMSKPMGQQTSERGSKFARNLTISPDEFMYKKLYSNPAIVFHFLQRIQPFTNYDVELNGKLFDDKNKLFNSIEKEWIQSSESSSLNVQELIPEFFILPEIFMNLNHVSLLNSNTNENENANELLSMSLQMDSESEFILPVNVKSQNSLSYLLRKELNENDEIEKWIDLVFGFKSIGEAALESLNVFSPIVNRKMTTFVSTEAELEEKMIEDGVMPTQLFFVEHPKKKEEEANLDKLPSLTKPNCKNAPILSQEILITLPKSTIPFYGEKVADDAYIVNGKIELINSHRLFQSIFGQIILFNDGLFNWSLPISFDSGFDSSSSLNSIESTNNNSSINSIRFSNDKSLIAVCLDCGALLVYRCFSHERKIESLKHHVSFFLPREYSETFSSRKFECCAVSSHLGLAIEATGSTLFCFHISSGQFVRAIEIDIGEIVDVEINDSLSLILAFGKQGIEAFTVNGTKIISHEIPKSNAEITAATIENNGDDLIIVTGHNDGSLTLWDLDEENESLKMKAKMKLWKKQVRMVKLFKEGGALLAIDDDGKSKIFVTGGVDGSLFQSEIVACCAGCGKKENQYKQCSMCKLFFCNNCVESNSNVAICKNCLERVVMNSSIDA